MAMDGGGEAVDASEPSHLDGFLPHDGAASPDGSPEEQDAAPESDASTPPGRARPTDCTEVMGDESTSTSDYSAVDLTYDSHGNPHYWYITGVGAIPYHFTLDTEANWWLGTIAGSSIDTRFMSVIMLGDDVRIATFDDWGRTSISYHASGDTPELLVPEMPVPKVVDLRGGMAADGYHVYMLLNAGGLVLRHIDVGHVFEEKTLAEAFVSASLAFGADGSVDVVWSDVTGQLWNYNDQRKTTRRLSANAGATGELNLLSNGAKGDPIVLFATASEWRLWREGAWRTVRAMDTPGTRKPALVRDGEWLYGAVHYQEESNTPGYAELLRLDSASFDTLASVNYGARAALAVRPHGVLDAIVWKTNEPRNQPGAETTRNAVSFYVCD